MFEVIVENVGSVYYGPDQDTAEQWYADYAGKYKPWGCDWFADVTLIAFDDISREYRDEDNRPDDID